MKKIQKIIAVFALLAVSFVLSGCGFKSSAPAYKTELEIWGPIGNTDAYAQVISDYRKLNPYITDIRYRKFTIDTYRQDLLEALASGRGPDIFLIRNSWMPAFQDKVVAAPDFFADERLYRNTFADVAGFDFIGPDKKIYGVPLSVDSLALYYNKDLLNAAGITTPPTTWEEFARDAALMTKVDSFGNITQSGAALGTAYNINRSTDVLTALMLQSGVPFWDTEKQEVNLGFNAGGFALDFYTQFANPRTSTYAWNSQQHYSVDAFYEGQAAMMINYSWQYETLKRKNSKLNFGVAPLPQFEKGQKSNYANYWGYVVAKNKSFGPEVTDKQTQDRVRVHEAWQFLKYLTFPHNGTITLHNALSGTTKDFSLANDPSKVYLSVTGQPAARRDIIEEQKKDVFLGPFVEGNLVAKNWYQFDPEANESVLAQAIDSINRGESTVANALNLAQTRLNRLTQ